MNEDVKKLIMLIEVHFPRPKFSGDDAKEAIWLRSMDEIFGGFSGDLLGEAAVTIVRTRDPEKNNTMFPKPKEIIDVIDRIQRRRDVDAFAAHLPAHGAPRLASTRNLPEFRIEKTDPMWAEWVGKLSSQDKDLASDAERAGYIVASSPYPRGDSVIFEPYLSGKALPLLQQLKRMN